MVLYPSKQRPNCMNQNNFTDDIENTGKTVEQRFLVEGECDGFRLDKFLCKKIKRLSRNRIQRVIEGECTIDGKQAKSSRKVYTGQEVRFIRPAPQEPIVPKDFSIVLEDKNFYVIDKPAGLPVHPSAKYHYSTLTAALKERFPTEHLQIAHRLDKETSGLVLIARNKKAASTLKQAFAHREVEKYYKAIVHGHSTDDEFTVDLSIGPDSQSKVRVKMGHVPIEKGGQSALTHVKVLQRFSSHMLVECQPFTGRQHQIRVHLSCVGHPIVGDKMYPNEEIFLKYIEGGEEAVMNLLPIGRQALHAAKLVFRHPDTKETIVVQSELPQELSDFLQTL